MSQTLFMETTTISAEKTVGEIQKLLGSKGASAVMMEYDGVGGVSAVAFRFKVDGGDVPFRLPCRWEAIAEILRKRAGISDNSWRGTWDTDKRRRAAVEEKSKRVAWRQILRWVQAQLALVETAMVTVDEVFFPYVQLKGGTIYQIAKQRGLAALEYKGGPE